MDSAVFLAVLAVFSTMVVGLFKIIDTQNKAQALLAENLKDNTDSNREIADATNKGNEEAKIRNGHLGEQNIKIAKLVTSQNTDVKGIRNTNNKIVELLKLNKDQHIETQIVDVQTVNKEK